MSVVNRTVEATVKLTRTLRKDKCIMILLVIISLLIVLILSVAFTIKIIQNQKTNKVFSFDEDEALDCSKFSFSNDFLTEFASKNLDETNTPYSLLGNPLKKERMMKEISCLEYFIT